MTWQYLICSICGKRQYMPFNESPFTCYDCIIETKYGQVKGPIINAIKDSGSKGLSIEEIVDKFKLDNPRELLEWLQGDLIIEELFDDIVTNDLRWYIRR